MIHTSSRSIILPIDSFFLPGCRSCVLLTVYPEENCSAGCCLSARHPPVMLSCFCGPALLFCLHEARPLPPQCLYSGSRSAHSCLYCRCSTDTSGTSFYRFEFFSSSACPCGLLSVSSSRYGAIPQRSLSPVPYVILQGSWRHSPYPSGGNCETDFLTMKSANDSFHAGPGGIHPSTRSQ